MRPPRWKSLRHNVFKASHGQACGAEVAGKSAEDARRNLVARIAAELAVGPGIGAVNAKTTLDELFDLWMPAKIAEDGIGERTQTLYQDTWRLHGRKQLGQLRITELPTSRADAHIKSLPQSPGIYMRIILMGMYNLAARFDVVKHNPIRETKTPRVEREKARALTAMELARVRQAVKIFCDYRGPGPRRGVMLPAFVELLAATGDRPGRCWPSIGTRWTCWETHRRSPRPARSRTPAALPESRYIARTGARATHRRTRSRCRSSVPRCLPSCTQSPGRQARCSRTATAGC